MTDYSTTEMPSDNTDYSMMDIETTANDGAPTDSDTLWQQQLEETEQQIIKEKEGKRGCDDSDGEHSAKKRATEFEKYWLTVTDNPQDFQSWTVLLQHVDQNSELEEGKRAYDKFFERYPYCYGYWKKYSDLEKRKGTQESTLEVFNRGLEAIPLSVDLWIHYLEFIVSKFEDNEDFIREQYERSIESCGLEFRSDRLWDSYIAWETRMTSTYGLQRVVQLYDRLLATPISKYVQHWQKFQEFVKNYLPSELLSADEFQAIRKSIVKDDAPPAVTEDADAPPGEESSPGGDASTGALAKEEETKQIQNHMIELREAIHEQTGVEAKIIWSYEDAVKRPYFHVKPLEKSQLAAWRAYLHFQINEKDDKRTRILFDRCLIACALYEEFWIRYVEYLEMQSAPNEEIRSLFEKVCFTHLPNKLNPHLAWAAFEEASGEWKKAMEILLGFQARSGVNVEAQMALVGIHRRQNNIEAAEEAFQSCMEHYKSKEDGDGYAGVVVKYARFTEVFLGSPEKAVELIKQGLELFEDNPTLLLALNKAAMNCRPPKIQMASDAIRSGTKEGLNGGMRITFAYRFLHFTNECGESAEKIREAMRLLRDTRLDVHTKPVPVEDNANVLDKDADYNSDSQKSKSGGQVCSTDKSVNGTGQPNASNGQQNSYQNYQNQSGYGAGYNQGYSQNYNSQQYQNWGYQPQQGNYGYNQQGWGGYSNYYGGQR